MIGYDSNAGTIRLNDPANNAGVHSWVAEAANFNVVVGANDFTFNVGGATAIAYGAVVAEPVPESSTWLLLTTGAAGLAALRRRKT